MNNFIKINDFLQNNNPIPLKTNFIAIFEHLAKLGKVSTTLFSNSLNHTVQGKFADMHSRNNTLMHFHPNIDTRLFTAKWIKQVLFCKFSNLLSPFKKLCLANIRFRV